MFNSDDKQAENLNDYCASDLESLIEQGIPLVETDETEIFENIRGLNSIIDIDKPKDSLSARERCDVLRIFFQDIQKYPLLTPDEEKTLGKIIADFQNEILASALRTKCPELEPLRIMVRKYQASRKNGNEFPKSRQQLCTEIEETLQKTVRESLPLESLEEVEGQISQIKKVKSQKKFCEAREKLVNSNLRLVVKIAKKYVKPGRLLPDLIQDGAIGLMKAAEKFEYEKGFKFSTYASRWIVQAMASGISQKNRQIHLPLHVMADIAKVMSAIEDLEKELGHSPDHKQIAEKAGLSLFDIKRAFECLRLTFLSIDTPSFKYIKEELTGVIPDERPSPFDRLTESFRDEKIEAALSSLPNRRDAEILRLRFQEFTLEEIGRTFKRTRERIRQIEKRNLNKLKSPRFKKLLEDL